MKKSEKFYRFLISRFEQISSTTDKGVVYFDSIGNQVPDDQTNCKWWVADGVVYDNHEKVSSKMAKYSSNLGLLL